MRLTFCAWLLLLGQALAAGAPPERTARASALAAAAAHSEARAAALDRGALDAAQVEAESTVSILGRALPARDPLLGDALRELGKIQYARYALPAAAATLERALALLESGWQDSMQVEWCQSDLAEVERARGRFDRAESLMVRSVARSRSRVPQSAGHAVLLNNLASLYWDENRFDESERLFRESLALSLQDPAATGARRATAYLNLGVLTRDQGKFDESDSLLSRAIDLARTSFPDGATLAFFLNEGAKLAAARGAWPVAVRTWDQALGELERSQPPHPAHAAQILHDSGRASLEHGDLAAAGQKLEAAAARRERALGPRHPDFAASLAAWAEVDARRGAKAVARARVQRALEIFATTRAAEETEAEARILAARLDYDSGRRDAALAELDRALAQIERLRPQRGGGDAVRARLVARFRACYDDAVAWRVEAGRLEEALRAAEGGRARTLRDRLAAGGRDALDDVAPEKRRALLAQRRRAMGEIGQARRDLTWERASLVLGDTVAVAHLAQLEAQLERATHELGAIEDEIDLNSRTWQHTLRRPVEGIAWRQVVPRAGALLLFAVGVEKSFLFVAPPEPSPLTCYPLAVDAAAARALGIDAGPLDRARLEAALARVMPTLERPDAAIADHTVRGVTGTAAVEGSMPRKSVDANAALHALWRSLVPGAAWQVVQACSSTVLLPDAGMEALPFEALVVRQASSGAPSYWLDSGPPLRYAHSLATLATLQTAPPPRSRRTILSASDAIYDPNEVARRTPSRRPAVQTLQRLPGTGREADAVRRSFANWEVILLRGRDATESALRRAAPRARILHFGTHALVDERVEASLSALLLTPPARLSASGTDDGYLHLFEIATLGLDCDLAVLSACDTHRGAEVPGEGVFALSRGFLAGGARRVVASLWPVADATTAEIVTGFFAAVAAEEARTGGLDATRCLRDAKRTVRRDPRWSHPFFWAPLVIMGAE